MDLTIGCTTRPYNALSFAGACTQISRAGYTDVAVFAHDREMPVDSSSTKQQVSEVKAAAAEAGLAPSMLLARTHLELGLDGAVEDYKRLIDNAAELGTRWLLELGTSKEEYYGDYPELMRQAAPHAEQAGVGISLKPHGGISLTARQLVDLHTQVGHPAFGLSYDPGNIIYYTKGDVRPEDEVDEVASRTTTLIIKDCTLDGEKADVAVTAGDGLVDFNRVLSGLVNGGFGGPMYVECVGGKTPEAVDRDAAFTLGYIKGILTAL